MISGCISIKRILGQVRRAIQDYDMIHEGDRIAVGISGGKDSLALLFMLSRLRTFYPCNFDIEAVTVSLGSENEDYSSLQEYCTSIGVRHNVIETYIHKIVFEIRKEQNPCSLCANLRYGALNNAAKALNCSRVALGHNRDDVIETFMMSLIFEARLHTFSPVTWLSKKELYLIRPLIYTGEREIKGFIKEYGLPVTKNPCPAAGETKREYIKDLIKQIVKEKYDIKSNLFGVIARTGINGWKQTDKNKG
jgi:tRNA(Ile)-lysidine synthetase-like protein